MACNIAVIGGGAWGTTLSLLLAGKGNSIKLWVFEEEVARQINQFRENKHYLPGILLPQEIEASTGQEIIKNCEIIFIAVPSQFYRSVITRLKPSISRNAILVSATKGLDPKNSRRMSEIIEEELKTDKVAVISGPNISKEIAKGLPAAAVIASKNIKLAEEIQSFIISDSFRVYTSQDIIGVELGGTLKNIIALAAGIVDGLNLGNNAKAGILVRGMAEIIRLGTAMGAKPETFMGLSGMGDLITTCSSPLSRNHFVGEQLSLGKNVSEITNSMKSVAEGINAAKIALDLAKKYRIEMPITEQVCQVLFNGLSPLKAVDILMSRLPKKEH
jgi:glycerol-3-phosphate dehydrogenase (NAD(P)+)